MTRFDRPVLMWVTDRLRSNAPLPELAQATTGAGIDLIHVRESNLARLPLELLVLAIDILSAPETRVVVNSDFELARKSKVGVHLPEAGPSIAEARQALGPDALVGRSVHSVEAAMASEGASYLVAGHIFETGSKPGRTPLGLDTLASIVASVQMPVIAIGGITPERVASILETGAAGAAVMSPFTELETIRDRVLDYRTALEQTVSKPGTSTITVTINGKTTELPAGTTISGFLAGRDLHERLVVVERNGIIVKRDRFAETIIEEGDLLEIVHFVGGG